MRTHFTARTFIIIFGIVLGLGLQPALADQPNLFVMSEDADDDAVPRKSRVFRRVITAIQNQMVDQGFAVYDETMVTMDDYVQGRSRRSRTEILDIARTVSNPPIDVVTNFLIYASVNEVGYTAKVRVRIEGEILHVKSKKYLGNFESVSPRQWNISPKCAKSRECVLEEVGEKSRIIGNDVGSVLAEKLAYMVKGGASKDGNLSNGNQLETAYEIVLDGFSPDDVMAMEEYLIKFTGYQSHRQTYNSNRRAEMWYEGTTTSSRMNRNMTKMLDVLDLRGTVQFSGNKIVVQKISLRGKEKSVPDDVW
jgi:hypothetical protein